MIEQPTVHHGSGITTLIGVLSAIYAATFFLGALLHLGVEVPLGLAVLDEPRILPATIVEGLCGLALAVAALAVFARVDRAWTARMVWATCRATARVLARMARALTRVAPSKVSSARCET